MKIQSILILLLAVFAVTCSKGDDFFDITHISYHPAQPDIVPLVFKQVEQLDKNNQKINVSVYEPFLEVHVTVKDQIKASGLIGKAYFYDATKKLIATATKPEVVDRGNAQIYDWPVIFPKDKDQAIYFVVPDQVLQQTSWSAVVVFGDAKGVAAEVYPRAEDLPDYDYAEKSTLEDRNGLPIDRKPAPDPVIEHVVQTGNPNQPQITLFLRPPLGMTDASQAKGVLCMSMLAGDVEGVKRQLQGFEVGQDVGDILKFAQDHKLVIIAWGAHNLWDPQKNWDDLTPDEAFQADKAFDQVANAWDTGVQYFIKEDGIPKNGYLMIGFSASAQYACRLALRKPDYFLAVHVHVPSSFDKPTPEGRKILWCLTTGELESGHARSLRFYAQCRELGYPMIYKAAVGIGHEYSSVAGNLGLKFFEYALSVRDQRAAYDDSLTNPLAQLQAQQTDSAAGQPWIESFRKPAFVGDVVNQEIFPFNQVSMIPEKFRTPLPTKEIADAWNQ
jgi:hypothetical protein